MFIIAPHGFNLEVSLLCFIVFIIGAIDIIRKDKARLSSYLGFNTIFLFSFLIVTYFFPILIYENVADSLLKNLVVFSEYSINRMVSLSTFAINIYFYCYEKSYKKYKERKYLVNANSETHTIVSRSSIHFINALSVFSVVMFTLNAIYFVLTNASDKNDLTTNPYISEFAKCSVTVALIVSSHRHRDIIMHSTSTFVHKNFLVLVCFFVVMMEYIFLGDRGYIITGSLTILFVYSLYVKPIKLKFLISMGLVGIFFLSLIGQLRKTEGSFREGGIGGFVSSSRELLSSSDGNALDFLSDLTVVSCVSYIGYDYKDANGYFYPLRLIIIPLNPIPFVPSLLSYIFLDGKPEMMSTGTAITDYYHQLSGWYGDGGLGSNSVIDLYMSWDIIGVLLGFVFLGYVIGRANATYKDSLIQLVIIIAFFGMAVYIPRSTVYVCYRSIVWQILLLYFLKKQSKRLKLV